ncbi:MAG: hypothetical protein ACO1SV_11560 [Fimbriimonas sp.]
MKTPNARRPRPFGPATRIALVGVLGVLGYSFATRPSDTGISDLQAVRDRIAAAPPPPPLRKPEVSELLTVPELALAPLQRERIRKLDARWQATKGSLREAMQGFAVEGGSTELRLRTELLDYSALSRRYDAERARYWQAAQRLLTDGQRRAMAGRQGVSR